MHFDILNTTTTNSTNVTSSEAPSQCNGIPVNIPFIQSLSALWVVYSIAVLFVMLSWVISFYLIYKHLKYYTQPEHQRYIVRLLCMVPLYGLYSLLSLIFHQHQTYFAIARDCYEAYALFMFFKLCVSYGGGKDAIVEHFQSLPKLKLTFPLGCWRVQPNELFFTVCKQGMLQYVLIRPIVSIWAALLEMFGAYGDGSFAADMGYVYASIINNVCVMIALYIVVLFEQAASELLHPYRPILKFLSVKMVIFLAFWQQIMIALFAHYGWIPSVCDIPSGDVATGLQNFLMCFEMTIVALLHIVAYPYELYRVRALTNVGPMSSNMKTSVLKNMVNMMNQADLLKDTLESLNIQRGGKKDKDKEKDKEKDKDNNINQPVHHHPFGNVPIYNYPPPVTPSHSSLQKQPSRVRFHNTREEREREDEGGLLVNASFEPVSSPPPGDYERESESEREIEREDDYEREDAREREMGGFSQPPVAAPATIPRAASHLDFNPRQRHLPLEREMEELADDDDLLDELDDEDLDYDSFRR